MNAWILTAFGLNIAMIMMAVAWAIARRIGNAGWLGRRGSRRLCSPGVLLRDCRDR